MTDEIKVDKGWLILTTVGDLPARVCAANVTGIVSISGRHALARVFFAGSSIEVKENGTNIQAALDKWYGRPKGDSK